MDNDGIVRRGKSNHNHDSSTQCAWVNKSSGHHCRMMGVIGTHGGGDWYCSWHYHVGLRDPEWAEDYEQFAGWRESIMRDYPKAGYLPAGRLWAAMTEMRVDVIA